MVPKLWTETIEAHRHAVRETVLDTAWALVTERGPLAVTMSQIAEQTGIGRATLYKYFPDVEAILVAWHDRHVAAHLDQLADLRDQAGDADARLEAVLRGYALICHHRGRHSRPPPPGRRPGGRRRRPGPRLRAVPARTGTHAGP